MIASPIALLGTALLSLLWLKLAVLGLTAFHHSSREAGFPTARRIPWTDGKIVRVSGGATCQEEASQNKQQ